ncbi:MAG: hypothetical protein RLZZ292_3487 [Bacteroidota bacterium]|jgi:hypothetical protein
MKMKKITYFLFFLSCLTACKRKTVVGFPADLADEKPIFNLSADIEGRATHLDFVAGEGHLRMTVGEGTNAFTNPFNTYVLETQLGPLTFTYPFVQSSFFFSNQDIPFFEDDDGVIKYRILGQNIGSFSTVETADVLIDGKITAQLIGGYFDTKLLYPPEKIEIRNKVDKNIYQTFYNPAEQPLAPNMAFLTNRGLVVGSSGATAFKWSTGSATPISLIDSSAASKYYCVTTTGTNNENRVEACGLLTQSTPTDFSLQAENWGMNVTPEIISFSNPNDFYPILSFKDLDGTVYQSILGKQPATSFFTIDNVSIYNASDFGTVQLSSSGASIK